MNSFRLTASPSPAPTSPAALRSRAPAPRRSTSADRHATEQVIVVGAGSAGLAAAAELARRRVSTVVLEESDAPAGAWRGRYDRLRLNSTKGVSTLPGARWPAGTPAFPTRDDLVRYLGSYATRHALDIRLGTRVTRIDRRGDERGWVVYAGGAELHARAVIVATGHARVPHLPAWAGREQFDGLLLHAAQYRNPTGLQGRDVLIVGGGSSGMEIAYDLVTHAARVRVAVRTPPNLLLRSPAGPTIAKIMYHLPVGIADRLTRVARRRGIGDLSGFGLPIPEEGMFRRLRRLGVVPTIVDREVIDAIRSRRIEIVGAVAALGIRHVELADSERIAPEVVIAATGYRTGLDALVGHLGVLDERGTPRVAGGDAAPGLHFVGFVHRPAQIGYGAREATAAARAIAEAVR